jgi:hypothetical protein
MVLDRENQNALFKGYYKSVLNMDMHIIFSD